MKHGYKNVKSMKRNNRRKALNKALKEYGAPKIIKKLSEDFANELDFYNYNLCTIPENFECALHVDCVVDTYL